MIHWAQQQLTVLLSAASRRRSRGVEIGKIISVRGVVRTHEQKFCGCDCERVLYYKDFEHAFSTWEVTHNYRRMVHGRRTPAGMHIAVPTGTQAQTVVNLY